MTFTQLATIAAAGVNLYALVALALGLRPSAEASTLRRLARRCGISVVSIAVLSAISFAITPREGFDATDPSQKATRIASTISEAINCGAFAVFACALPAVVGLWLAWKARRAA